MALVIDDIDVEKVTSLDSDSSGCYRDVYFVGNIVLKVEQYGDEGMYSNEDEWGNYLRVKEFHGKSAYCNGIEFTIAFPEMKLIDGYMFAERVRFPHISSCDTVECALDEECNSEDCQVVKAVSEWCIRTLRLYDIHSENFCWDADTRTAWIIDLGA